MSYMESQKSYVEAAQPGCQSEDALLDIALAEELVNITRLLGNLAYDLGSDPDTLRRHMTSLQDIDRITQMQLAIVQILRSHEPARERIAAVTLQDMAVRLDDMFEKLKAGEAPDL